ncbi:hypothetical protein PUNSTDRAFT_118713 [Punctularia strigosozonata HHB-11173 SS5]|uniref:uncharacterized protein n=1 Tax=Punctularia strigosozonata (strain HHB-11173) TaxID=741275 RepID=UPI0004417618|nr:uncharacterized protein PUNSTDRAFT_118713 [Punctularia strigosozonata HHB-11173 SS5]EIN11204.1 hypothetical protein PUNSTDRAFT_118713 [Punctularia strigosozonata HHB-11173 SS5]
MAQEQERELRTQLKNAERLSGNSTARKEALTQLIQLVHSSHVNIKSLVAENIPKYIKYFPDLEDDAINAVYDLCEDPDQQIRLKGYQAILAVSQEDRKWVRRNADVLVQLLQSDDAQEVKFVGRKLAEHLDIDPRATFGVFLDQIVPPDESREPDEQVIRDNLRRLVIAYMRDEVKRGSIVRHCQQNGDVDNAVVNGMLRAVAKLDVKEADIIVKDILLVLPSYRTNPARGVELLQTLCDRARAALKEDLQESRQGAKRLDATSAWLALATHVVTEKKIGTPIPLLGFYLTSILRGDVLLSLAPEEQVAILSGFASLLSACSEIVQQGPSTRFAEVELPGIQRQTVGAGPVVLEAFASTGMKDIRCWTASKTFLDLFKERKEKITTPQFIECLKKLQTVTNRSSLDTVDATLANEVKELIKTLLPHEPPPEQRTRRMQVSQKAARANGAKEGPAGGKANGKSTPEPGQLAVDKIQNALRTTAGAGAKRKREDGQATASLVDRIQPSSGRATPIAERVLGAATPSTNGGGQRSRGKDGPASLLERLSTSGPTPSRTKNEPSRPAFATQLPARQAAQRASEDAPLSIKGAAKRESQPQRPTSGPGGGLAQRLAGSLADRVGGALSESGAAHKRRRK